MRSLSQPFLLAALSLGVLGLSHGLLRRPASAEPVGPRVSFKAIRLKDETGKVRQPKEFAGKKAVVIVFLGTECPIANSYAPELARMAKDLGPRGVQFIGVNSNREDAKAVAAHARSYSLGFPILRDEKQELADLLGAKVTPEAFVLDAESVVRYQGRIDDGYASRARKAAAPKSRDLANAVEAVLGGRPVETPKTLAIGCAIARPTKPVNTAKVTFHKDVEPILQQRCQSCHRPGQVAPFSLLTYRDAKSWAGEIKEFTHNRQMPPWLAEPDHGEFQDVRRMSDAELKTIAEWADSGAPQGSAKDAPPAKQWSDEWMLGKPDLVLTPTEEYEVAASGNDEFRVFVLPTGLTEDKQVIATDFRPGNSAVVHHVVSFVDTSGKARKLDAEDAGPGYNSGPGGIKVPAAIQGVWAPGNLPRFLPTGVGRPLPKNGDVVIQVHYHKTGKPEKDRTKVALYFAKEPVKKTAHTALLGPFNIDIPPDAARHEQKASMTLPLGVKVLNIMPHMHLLGREMKVTATLPDGTKKDMVWIKDWDYRWQDSYRYKEPLKLPAGTKVEVVAYFDNTSANPRNPSSPPRRVRFGEQTTDEMAFAIMEVVPGLD